MAQSLGQIGQLTYAVIGGEIGDDGQETIRSLTYNAIFNYGAYAIQEQNTIVKTQQEQIDAQTTRLIN